MFYFSMLFSAILSPFSGVHPMITLIPISLLIGIAMLWVFARTSNQQAIKKVKARLQAYLYEMLLFTDEPVLIWKAQCGLLAANAKYIGLMLVPALVATIPMILIFAQLECYYGHSPLQVGREAIVTAHLKDIGEIGAPKLEAPQGINVETPAVRAEGGREVSWRVRAAAPVKGDLQLVFPSGTVSKTIDAGTGPQYVSERRVSSFSDQIWYPGESRIANGPVDWIEISYPSATVHALGIDLHWLIWLLLISMISALIFKNRFRVSF
jgi:hypothetical protein